LPAPGTGGFRVLTQKKIQQEHILLMASAPSAESADRFGADVLASAVGDGTGSRLFWELVDPGLAETAELDYHEFQGTGTFMTYVCCEPDNVSECMQRIRKIYGQVTAENISADELQQVKNKAASRIVLRSERPMGRLLPLGFNWVYRQEYRTVDDDLATLGAVQLQDLARVLSMHPLDRITTVAIGPMTDEQFRAAAGAA
jgi:predicted Zn-dependent peptidase